MTLPRHFAVSLLLDTPLPTRGSTVIELTREAGGWIAWLVDMDVPENTRTLGPFRGRREARRAAKAALDGVADCPEPKAVRVAKTSGSGVGLRPILDLVGQRYASG